MGSVWMFLSWAAVAVEETHGHEQTPNATEFKPDLAIFTVIVFVGLVYLLGRYAWRPILQGLERREKRIADNVDSAKRMHDEAKLTLAEYEQRLAAVNQQTNELIAEAKREAAAAKDRIVAEAAAEAQKQRDRAVADIRAAKETAIRELAQKTAESAVNLAGNIVGRTLREADHQKLIDESIDRFVKSA